MSLYMETTKISATKTAAEIQEYLAASGARQILTKYDHEGNITGLSFILHVEEKPVPFTLPVRSDALFNYFQKKAAPRNRAKSAPAHLQQAERVAWRCSVMQLPARPSAQLHVLLTPST